MVSVWVLHYQGYLSDVETGELEGTLLHKWWEKARLRQWLVQSSYPDIIGRCKSLIDKAYNVHKTDDVTSTAFTVHPSSALASALGGRRPRCAARHKHNGVFYNQHTTLPRGNSLVLFCRENTQARLLIPGRLRHIFLEGSVVYAAIQVLKEVGESYQEARQMIKQWRELGFGGDLYSETFASELEIVRFDQIEGHFGYYGLGNDVSIVLNLNEF